MRFPTATEVARLRSDERNFSRIYLGVQRGIERGDATSGVLNVGQHYRLRPIDGYVAAEHLLYFGSLSLNNTDIRPNMTLLVGTATDPSAYGSVRIRAIGLGAAPTGDDGLYLEPNELFANGYLQPGDHIWVDGIFRLYRKLPHIVSGTVYEDGNPNTGLVAAGIPGYGIGYATGYLDRPVALMGSPRFAWAGEEIDFYGWRSHGRGAYSIQNWLWNFDGGTCLGPGIGYPGSPMSPVHARWDTAGEYIASLTVEDNSGRITTDQYGVQFNRHTAVRPVLVYDRPGTGDNPPYENFEVESLVGKYGSGWTTKIKVFGTADSSEFPDNALIIIYAEDWHGGERGSIGGWYGQENILFIGHIRADSVTVDFEKSTVSFEAQTIEQWMKEIDIWPANFTSTAGTWHGFANMTIEDILWYLTEMRSNLKDVTDCFFASDVNAEKQVDFLDLTEASLYDQMSEQIGSCFFGQLSASRHGSIHLSKHKNMLDISERIWWGPPVYSFSRQDWRDEIQIGEERQRDSVAQVDFVGFIYDANGNPQEVYSLAPARQTNFGKIEKVTGILLTGQTIAAAQAENNTLSGLYLAWKNIRFPHISVPTKINNRVLEPATLDYFAVVLVASDTVRGYTWAGKEFLTTGISVKIDNESGIIHTDVEGEASTWGPDGVAGPYPYNPPSSNPPETNPPEYWPSSPPGATPENPTGDPPPWIPGDTPEEDFSPITAYMGLGTGHVIRGTGLGPGLGYSCQYHNCGVVHSDGINWMALDEFDPENTAMVCTQYRIYRTKNLSDDNPDWELMFYWGTGNMFMVRSSPVQEGLWMVAGYDDTDIHVWWTVNGGVSWSTTNFTVIDADGCAEVFLEMSTHDPNMAWVMWVDNNNGRTYIATTDDMWATQTLTYIPTSCFTGAGAPRPCCHHRAYDNPDDSERIYGGTTLGGATDYARIYKSPDCTTLYSDGTASYIVWVRMVGCGIRTRSCWWALARGLNTQGFWVSDDGVAWTEQQNWDFGPGGNWYLRDAKNLRGNWQWYIMARDGTAYPLTISVNRGAGWYPQFGNWPAFVTDEGLGALPVVAVVCPVFEV